MSTKDKDRPHWSVLKTLLLLSSILIGLFKDWRRIYSPCPAFHMYFLYSLILWSFTCGWWTFFIHVSVVECGLFANCASQSSRSLVTHGRLCSVHMCAHCNSIKTIISQSWTVVVLLSPWDRLLCDLSPTDSEQWWSTEELWSCQLAVQFRTVADWSTKCADDSRRRKRGRPEPTGANICTHSKTVTNLNRSTAGGACRCRRSLPVSVCLSVCLKTEPTSSRQFCRLVVSRLALVHCTVYCCSLRILDLQSLRLPPKRRTANYWANPMQHGRQLKGLHSLGNHCSTAILMVI